MTDKTDAGPQSPASSTRTAAEWVTFAVTSLVLAIVVVLAAVQIGDDAPADPVAEQDGAVSTNGTRFSIPVSVRNAGDETAAEVQVVAELTIDGMTTESDQTIAFLAGQDEEHLVFVFDQDPAAGEVTIRVGGWAEP